MVEETLAGDIVIVLTLLLLEAVLSFDNAAILAAMVRKLPPKDRRKALLYGLVGAYALRFAAIALATVLIDTPSLKIIGGAYLVYIAARHFLRVLQHRSDKHRVHEVKPGLLARWGVPALVAVIIQIELVDLAFAIDQVIVAVAFTDKMWLIVIASFIGILFLRLAAAVISRVMDWLPTLEHMAYIAVGYVGFKLILLHDFFVTGAQKVGQTADGLRDVYAGGSCRIPFIPAEHEVAIGALPGCEVPHSISVGITLGLFLVPVAVKLLFGIPRSHRPEGASPALLDPEADAGVPAAVASATGQLPIPASDAPAPPRKRATRKAPRKAAKAKPGKRRPPRKKSA